MQGEGPSIAPACKQIAVSQHTYYKWPQRYGSMKVDEAKRLKDLERENQQLKKLVADLALDNQMLTEVARGNALAPGQATPGAHTLTRKVRGLRTSGRPRHWARQIQLTLCRNRVRLPSAPREAVASACRTFPALRLSKNNGAPAERRLESEPHTNSPHLEARGLESSAETTNAAATRDERQWRRAARAAERGIVQLTLPG